jgi:hypothetical protein
MIRWCGSHLMRMLNLGYLGGDGRGSHEDLRVDAIEWEVSDVRCHFPSEVPVRSLKGSTVWLHTAPFR